MMKKISDFFAKLFKRQTSEKKWAGLDYGKPSTAGDDFRKNNEA